MKKGSLSAKVAFGLAARAGAACAVQAVVFVVLSAAGVLSVGSAVAACIATGSVLCVLSVSYVTRGVTGKLRALAAALEPIDFGKDRIDFSFLDNIEFKDSDFEINFLSSKFKDLSDVLVGRIDRVNSEMYKSEHDPLSGLYNREKFQNMKGEYYGCSNVCVIFIDVNNLKKMNDIYGHEAGDALIKASAAKLKWWDGIGDSYRMGGDEFMVVVANKPRQECDALISKWYPTVGVLNRADDGFKCMMAIGVSYGGLYSDMDELVKLADERMYYHKVEIKKANGEDPNSR